MASCEFNIGGYCETRGHGVKSGRARIYPQMSDGLSSKCKFEAAP
jgi:hypothetical protein